MSAATPPEDAADRLAKAADRLRRDVRSEPEQPAVSAPSDDLLVGLDSAQARVREARRKLAELESVLGFDYRVKRA
jgi:hypothetical protein